MTIVSRFRVGVAVAGAAVLLVCLSACGGGPASSSSGPIKVGAQFPLTGVAAANGEWAKLGIEVAVAKINADGGIDGRKVEVEFADNEFDPTKAVTEVTRLLNQEQVEFVFGPLGSDQTIATLPMLNSAKVASINGSGAETLTPEVAPYSYSMLLNATTQANKMVDSALDSGAKAPALIASQGTQGTTATKAMTEELEARNIEPAAVADYALTSTDLTAQLLELKGADPDVLMLFATTGVDTGRVIKAANQLNWDIPIIANYGATFVGATEEIAGPDAYDNVSAVTFRAFSACSAEDAPESTVEFVKEVREFSPERAEDASLDSVAMMYDAVYLFKSAVEATGTTEGTEIAEWLANEGSTIGNDVPLVNTQLGLSDASHFVMGEEALALVNPGEQVSDHIFKRLDCK